MRRVDLYFQLNLCSVSSLGFLRTGGINHSFKGYALSANITVNGLQPSSNLSNTSVFLNTLASCTLPD